MACTLTLHVGPSWQTPCQRSVDLEAVSVVVSGAHSTGKNTREGDEPLVRSHGSPSGLNRARPWITRPFGLTRARAGHGSPGRFFSFSTKTLPSRKCFTVRVTPKITAPHRCSLRGAQGGARLPHKNTMITGEPCAQTAESRLGRLIPEPRHIRGKWTVAGARLHLPHVPSQLLSLRSRPPIRG